MKGSALFSRGDNYEIVKIHWQDLKIFKFNQTWHKASLGEGDSIFFFKINEKPINSHKVNNVFFFFS